MTSKPFVFSLWKKCGRISLVPSRPRRFRMWRHLSSLSGKFAYRARFQGSSGHSDSANRPGYEAAGESHEGPVHTYPDILFLSGFGFRLHVSGESGIRVLSPEWKYLNTLWSGNVWTLNPDILLSTDVTRSSPVLCHEYSRRCRATKNLLIKKYPDRSGRALDISGAIFRWFNRNYGKFRSINANQWLKSLSSNVIKQVWGGKLSIEKE